jgi:hypothetical protein
MRIYVRDNRQLYKRAKEAFNETNPQRFGSAEQYWKAFGEANGMRVIITEWQGPYPVLEALEFNTEADYAWFLLRYS